MASASTICPTRSMQPQPLSEVPPFSRGGKSRRYVTQMREQMSWRSAFSPGAWHAYWIITHISRLKTQLAFNPVSSHFYWTITHTFPKNRTSLHHDCRSPRCASRCPGVGLSVLGQSMHIGLFLFYWIIILDYHRISCLKTQLIYTTEVRHPDARADVRTQRLQSWGITLLLNYFYSIGYHIGLSPHILPKNTNASATVRR